MILEPRYTVTIEIARFILKIEAHKDSFGEKPLTAQLLSSLRKSARLISTHYSTKIEGNRLTMEQVEQVVLQKGGFAGRERDKTEVENYYNALEYIETLLDSPVSENLIKTIHGYVMKGENSATKYRDGQNVIRDGITGNIVYMPPESKDVAPLMKNLVKWVNIEVKKKQTPVPIIAAIAHYQIATIHPYYDGNGRTARLLTTFILHRYGYGLKGIYSLEEYYAKNISGYYKALAVDNIPNYYMGRAEADITYFISYFMEAMADAFSKIDLTTATSNDYVTTGNSIKLRNLSPRQKAILTSFVDQKELSSKEIAEALGIKLRTTRNLIKKWLTAEFIEIADPSYKARTYRLCKDWEAMVL